MSDAALVLAAGLGTRMRSELAKVLHPLLGRPMVRFPVAAAQDAGFAVTVVVHHQEERVRAALAGQDVRFARQVTPRGTGDAVRAGLSELPEAGRLAVLAGDTPLFRAETLTRLAEAHGDNLVTVLTARVPDPAAYGRVLRGADGCPQRIVEAREATPEQLDIDEINTGVYLFDLAWLRTVLPDLQPHPPKGEIYLTDALELAAKLGRAGAVVHPDVEEVMGVNDRVALAEARHLLQQRVLRQHMLAGVTFEDPGSALVEADVAIGEDVTIGPGVVLRGRTVIERDVLVGPGCVLQDCFVGSGVVLGAYTVCEGAVVEAGAKVGPLGRLRPGARVGPGAHVGNFVEVKAARIGAGAKVNHLSYIGDAEIGENANIGAGTITCNYDGFSKHLTRIGAGAFIGSNSALVAPVSVGAGAIVGAGSVIVRDVPEDAVAVARGQQQNREGAAPLIRARKLAEKAQKQ